MEASSHRSRATLLGVLFVAGVIGLFLCVLIPVILNAREAERRSICINNMKQLGLGLLNHESARTRFPPSCMVLKDPATGRVTDMQSVGWSWCVLILPYIGPDDERLGYPPGGPLDKTQSARDALALDINEFHCPSFEGTRHVDPETKTEAITNYKAMGATHLSSLLVASPRASVPKYNPKGQHPDGGLFPGSRHGVDAFKGDGTAHSILLCESVEQNVARWTVGAETCVVGLPEELEYLSAPPRSADGRNLSYFAPKGYSVNMFNDQTTIPPENNLRYVNWDYDAKPYVDTLSGVPLVPRSGHASGPMKYGPSSHHSGVVNHLMADGSVLSISEEIDAALYKFLITRNGHDPSAGLAPEEP